VTAKLATLEMCAKLQTHALQTHVKTEVCVDQMEHVPVKSDSWETNAKIKIHAVQTPARMEAVVQEDPAHAQTASQGITVKMKDQNQCSDWQLQHVLQRVH